jgi:guanylate kinase
MKMIHTSQLLPRFETQFKNNFFQRIVIHQQAAELAQTLGSGKNLLILLGSSGAGRDSLLDQLVQVRQDFQRIRRITTRLNRYPEEEQRIISIPYEKFMVQFRSGEIVFAARYRVNRQLYGISRSELKYLATQNCSCVIEENLSALALKKLFPKSRIVLILPPSVETLKEHFINRGTSKEECTRRLRNSISEIKAVLANLEMLIDDGVIGGVMINNGSIDDCRDRLLAHLESEEPFLEDHSSLVYDLAKTSLCA